MENQKNTDPDKPRETARPESEIEERIVEDIEKRKPRRGVGGTVFRGSDLSRTVGSQTGEEDNDTVAGGWQGTDDATSTAPSDMFPAHKEKEDDTDDEDLPAGRAFAGGMGEDNGGVVDLKGTPVEESRNWENDPIEEEED